MLVLTVNGTPVYAEALPERLLPVTEQDLSTLAWQVTGDRAVADAWMDCPNPGLQGQTPRAAARQGQGERAAQILDRFRAP